MTEFIEGIMSLAGIIVTIAGTVVTIYVMVIAFRVEKKKDEFEKELFKIKKESKAIQSLNAFLSSTIYDYYSILAENDIKHAAKYRLEKARLACVVNSMVPTKKAFQIAQLAELIKEGDVNESEERINQDIKMLDWISKDDDEHPLVRDSAKKSMSELTDYMQSKHVSVSDVPFA